MRKTPPPLFYFFTPPNFYSFTMYGMNKISLTTIIIIIPTGINAFTDHYLGVTLQSPTTLEIKGTLNTSTINSTSKSTDIFDPKISSSKELIGWIELTDNCCTSYKLPTVLVIFKNNRVSRKIIESPPIVAWEFTNDSKHIKYRQEWPHGNNPIIYKIRRVSDGHVIDEFSCFIDSKKNHTAPPKWIYSILDGCPKK